MIDLLIAMDGSWFHSPKKISIVIYAYFMMEKAREMGLTLYVANGQVAAKGFYEKLGFIAEGEIFLDAGIEHIRMIRRE